MTSKAVVVSFEGENAKVIFASKRDKQIKIEDSLTLTQSEFDNFLQMDRSDHFIVVSEFHDSYQDTFILPPAKNKYIKPMLEKKIMQRHPDLGDFSFVHFFLGEKIEEGKRIREYFVISIKRAEIESIISRFIENGKTVKAIYPDTCIPAAILPRNDEPYIFAFAKGNKKNILVIKESNILLSRTSSAVDSGTTDLDIQDLNMTINHCRQTFRINPSFVMLSGEMSKNFRVSVPSNIPLVSLRIPESINVREPIFNEYFLPVAAIKSDSNIFAFHRRKNVPAMNTLTDSYKRFHNAGVYLRWSTVMFLILVLFMGILVARGTVNIMNTGSKVDSQRKQDSDFMGILKNYDKKNKELQEKTKMVNFIQSVYFETHPSNFLKAFSHIETNRLRIDSLNWLAERKSKGGTSIEIKGKIESDSYYVFQKQLKDFKKALINIEGVKDLQYVPDLTKKTFTMNLKYVL